MSISTKSPAAANHLIIKPKLLNILPLIVGGLFLICMTFFPLALVKHFITDLTGENSSQDTILIISMIAIFIMLFIGSGLELIFFIKLSAPRYFCFYNNRVVMIPYKIPLFKPKIYYFSNIKAVEFSKLEKTQRHDLIIRFRNDDYLRISSVEYSDFLTIKPFLQMHLDDFDELLDGIN